jgi:transcriptional regulator with XRE-family HTH domain
MHGISTLSSLGSAIRGERLRAGLTQAELAERAGMNRATVIGVESGSRFEIATLFALTRALGLEISLTTRDEPVASILEETDEL